MAYQLSWFILRQGCPVSWGCRIHWLHLCRGVRPPPLTSVLDMTLNKIWLCHYCMVCIFFTKTQWIWESYSIIGPVSRGFRIHRLHLYRGVRPPHPPPKKTSVQDIHETNIWRHSRNAGGLGNVEWEPLIGSYLWVKFN